MICNGGKEIFFLFLLHYNDTCKVNPSFTRGERKMIKLNILNMENFLDTVNACTGKVYMLCPNGKKQNINGEEKDVYKRQGKDTSGILRPSYRARIVSVQSRILHQCGL